MNHRTRLAVRRAVLAAAALLSSASALPQTQMPLYQVLDIGTLGGHSAWAYDINDLGEVTGSASTPGDGRHAFIYRDGEMIDLGTLKSDRYGSGASDGAAINNKGEVAGQAETESGLVHAVLYSNGVATDLGTLGGSASSGYALNESGQVSGISTVLPGTSFYHAFLYSSADGIKDLGTLGDTNSTGDAINDAGEVAGISNVQSVGQVFLYSHGSMTALLPGQQSYVPPGSMVLNASGHVAGQYRTADVSRSFLYRDGSVVDLGSLGGMTSYASSLNDSDQVTGDARTASGEIHAFLWSAGQMEDLGTLGGNYSNGMAINRSGQVTGQAVTAEGPYHPFVYTNGEMIDLGLPENGILGAGGAINAAGQVTGIYLVPSGNKFQPFYSRGLIATPISLLFSRLGEKAGSAGPGMILRDTARLAGWYYSRSDAKRTCGALTAFEIEATLFSYDRRLREKMRGLVADARSMKTTVGCGTPAEPRAESSSKILATVAVKRTLSAEEKEQALQWYREHFGIGADGVLIEGRLRDRRP